MQDQQNQLQAQQREIEELIGQTRDIASKIENQNDEYKKFREEQHDWAVHRARSYLSGLHSSINQLVEYDIDPNIPYSKEFEQLMKFKDEMVVQLEHIVNQSSGILDQRHLQNITDIIELARVNPRPFQTEEGLYDLDESHCVGIISQIESTLKSLPNPPV